VPEEQEHKYDDPALTTKEFLYAVMHDPSLELGVRMDAACKLLAIEAAEQVPTYYGEFPISRTVALTIRIGVPIARDGSESPGKPEVQVGFGPREDAAP
jgi:hypothetical protein